MDENLLHRRRVRREFLDDSGQADEQFGQAVGDFTRRVGLQFAVRDMREAPAVRIDDSPARDPQAGVEPDDPPAAGHPASLASTSSDTS